MGIASANHGNERGKSCAYLSLVIEVIFNVDLEPAVITGWQSLLGASCGESYRLPLLDYHRKTEGGFDCL